MKKLKIFLLLSILLCFGFVLSSEVHAQGGGPKEFEVADVLPATTQLRISWDSDKFPFTVRTDDDNFILIGIDDAIHYVDDIAVFDWEEQIWIPPYNSTDHAYVDINTSTWDESERTISYYNKGAGGNVYLYWEDLAAVPSGYSITFEENGDTSVTDLSGQIALPNPLPATTKSGYTFVNWYYDSAFTQIANPGDTIESNVTLYAKWQLNTYTVTYNSNGGSSIPQTSNATQLPNPLPTPTKSGYTFEGWYYDSDFTNEAFAGDPLTSDVTLYAKWEVLEIEPGYILPQSKVLINLTYYNTGGEKYGIVRYTIGTYGEILFTAVEEAPPTLVTSASISVNILNDSWGINLPFGDYVNQNFGTRTGLLSIGIIIDFSDATEVERTITNIYTTGTLEISIEILTDEVFFYENGFDTAREYYGWEDNGYWYTAEETWDMGYEDAREIYGYYDPNTDQWLSVDEYLELYGDGKMGQSDFYNNFDKYFIPAMIIVFGAAIVLTVLKVFKGRE